MKKILLFILCLTTMFLLVSCKKNEPVGRVTNDFISDFSLNSKTDYEIYDAIIKDKSIDNRLGRRYKPMKLVGLNFKSIKKVKIKNISFRIYNFSETDSFNIFVLDKAYYEFLDKDLCQINLMNDNISWRIETISPGDYYDVKLEFDDLKLKKNTNIELYYGVNYNASIQGIDIINDSMTELMNKITNSAGICNFKIDYVAYMKL